MDISGNIGGDISGNFLKGILVGIFGKDIGGNKEWDTLYTKSIHLY